AQWHGATDYLLAARRARARLLHSLAKELAEMKRNKTKTARTKPLWPWAKPLPSFKSEEEELNFWHSHEFEPPPDDEGEALEYVPGATRRPRKHVYQVRLDDQEMAKLQSLAR